MSDINTIKKSDSTLEFLDRKAKLIKFYGIFVIMSKLHYFYWIFINFRCENDIIKVKDMVGDGKIICPMLVMFIGTRRIRPRLVSSKSSIDQNSSNEKN